MNEVKLLGLSGKKQSGKTTTANYLVGVFLKALKITEDFSITDKGELLITDIFGNTEYCGIMDLQNRNETFKEFAEENIYPFVKVYSYADLLKKNICMDILGLTYEQCYGTNEEKNSITHLRWENMPGIITHEAGPMTAREVLQFAGTEIFRKMYGNVWVDATLRQIAVDRPSLAIISDVRFVNEVEGIVNTELDDISGHVIRFSRDVFKGQDQHESETALDDYKFPDEVDMIDNGSLTIDEQNKVVYDILSEKYWIPQELPPELLEKLPI
jgi:hypothetical protein